MNATNNPLYCQPYLDKIRSISLDNKYTKWYLKLCRRAAQATHPIEGKYDKHHILPTCFALGGTKDLTNLVKLTLREHFVCHLLLIRMSSGRRQYQMLAAAYLMGNRVNSSRSYAYLRERRDKLQGPFISAGLKSMYKNNPDVQIRRKATLASKPLIHCSKCGQNFRYINNIQRHKCFVPDAKISESLKARHIQHPEISQQRLQKIAALPELLCSHCNKVFRYLNRWRRHTGCIGNPEPNIECIQCKNSYLPLKGRKFCSKRCATIYNNTHRVLKKSLVL